ncbi:hypothetical protein WA1_35940 [Scytonema hofmannii PCC 7110]|uniref:Type I-U CRISPR-associated protein Cas5/Cas6 n=1 Tax=Scytonema hofmannii PCC 7110 TaxID=128403 RepID=A0A139X1P2_9CYAN|nr:type I-U CRISPR-associated protein Csb2 [Scytonema hofmannii]KYC38580.1 hypothetical protein WA1_35940 [Scytonema hofmannii PCC 7110]
MSVGISIQFLCGRYHATPWNHQVNEGVVEWPPSPWRILRALVAAYYRLPNPPARNELYSLLATLSECLPCYCLPEYATAHTRHYMPIVKEGKVTTTKVLDTFITLPGGVLSPDAVIQVVWQNVELNLSQQALFKQLCSQISYLGRAESWAEVQVIEEWSEAKVEFNAVPSDLKGDADLTGEKVRVLVPLSSAEMEGFKAALATVPLPTKKGKKSKWKVPKDILEALELDISDLHSSGWNGIPGTRWVSYVLPTSHSRNVQAVVTSREDKLPNFARFALASNVLPNITEVVSIGERFRQALMSSKKDENQLPLSVFSGRNSVDNNADEGDRSKPYLEGQQHAWYLPEVNARGKIDHMVIYAASGFDFNQALPKLKNLYKVWGTEGFDLQTVLVSLGQIEEYVVTSRQLDDKHFRVIGKSRKWRSLTPMVLPRHPKFYKNGNKRCIPDTSFQLDGVEHQALKLLTQLDYLNIPANSTIASDDEWLCLQRHNGETIVKVRCCDRGVLDKPAFSFQRRRYHGRGQKSSDKGYWLEIEFTEVQLGPIALGYAAHFGLGVFTPVFN